MSIKIYNGTRVSGYTLETLLPVLAELRKTAARVALEEAAAFVAKAACTSFDRVTLGLGVECAQDERLRPCHLSRAQDSLMRRQEEVVKSRRRDSAVDFEAVLSLHSVEGQLLVIPFAEHPRMRALWASLPGVTSFGYWNNSDMPGDTTELEWAERRRLWSLALNEFGAPADTGYSFELCPTNPLVYPDSEFLALVNARLPSFEERVDEAAYSVLVSETPKAQLEKLSDYIKLRKSPLMPATAERVRSALKARVTTAELAATIPPQLIVEEPD